MWWNCAMSNTDQAPEPSMEEILSSIRRIISDDETSPPSEETSTSASEDTAESKPEVTEEPKQEESSEKVTSEEDTPEEELVAPDPEPEAVTETVEESPETVPAADSEDDDDIFELTKVVEIDELPSEEIDSGDALDLGKIGVEVSDSGAEVADDIEFVEVEVDEPIMELPELGPEPVLAVAQPVDHDIADRLVSENVGVAAAASFGDLANTLLSRGDNASTLEELVQEMLRPLLKDWLDANLPTLVEKLVGEEIERIARRGR